MIENDKYKKKFGEIIKDDPELALDLHMEMREERNEAQSDAAYLHKQQRILIANVKDGIKMAGSMIRVSFYEDMYNRIMKYLDENDPATYKKFFELAMSYRDIGHMPDEDEEESDV